MRFNAWSSKRTNIRSFVTFRIFVSALLVDNMSDNRIAQIKQMINEV